METDRDTQCHGTPACDRDIHTGHKYTLYPCSCGVLDIYGSKDDEAYQKVLKRSGGRK